MPKINSLSPKIRKKDAPRIDQLRGGPWLSKMESAYAKASKPRHTTYAAAWKNRWENEGFAAFGLTDDMRQDAKRAFDIIRAEDSKLTLEHVAREFIKIYKQRTLVRR